jgi:hypothetical protein
MLQDAAPFVNHAAPLHNYRQIAKADLHCLVTIGFSVRSRVN